MYSHQASVGDEIQLKPSWLQRPVRHSTFQNWTDYEDFKGDDDLNMNTGSVFEFNEHFSLEDLFVRCAKKVDYDFFVSLMFIMVSI